MLLLNLCTLSLPPHHMAGVSGSDGCMVAHALRSVITFYNHRQLWLSRRGSHSAGAGIQTSNSALTSGVHIFMMHTPKRVWYFSRAFAFGDKWVRLAVVKVAFGKRYSDMFALHANTLRKTLTPRGRSSDEKSPACYTKLMNQCQNVKCSFWIIPNISSQM